MIDFEKFEEIMMFDLDGAERAELGRRLNTAVGGFAELEQADPGGAEPLVTVLDRYNVLRGDISEKMITRDELLSNAPGRHEGYFRVPETL